LLPIALDGCYPNLTDEDRGLPAEYLEIAAALADRGRLLNLASIAPDI
jgi:hypothetical protein